MRVASKDDNAYLAIQRRLSQVPFFPNLRHLQAHRERMMERGKRGQRSIASMDNGGYSWRWRCQWRVAVKVDQFGLNSGERSEQ